MQRVNISVSYKNQANPAQFQVTAGGVTETMRVADNGVLRLFGTNIMEIMRTNPNTAGVNRRVEVSGLNSFYDMFWSGATGRHTFRNFRYGQGVNGFVEEWYKGDGTATLSHSLAGGGYAQFCQDSTAEWNTPHLTFGNLHFFADRTDPANPKLRFKFGAPTSATDGTLVGP